MLNFGSGDTWRKNHKMIVFLTIFSGVVTFVLGQVVLKLLIDPVQEFKKTIADIALALIEYANIYANPGVANVEVAKKASDEFRKLSSRLNAQMYLIPSYNFTAKLFRLPSREEVVDSAKNLIGLSNGVFQSMADLSTVNTIRADKIRSSLNIFIPEDERIHTKKELDLSI